MTSMKDISCQLMKSPKELASWKFPLSEILDKYFNLLPEACKIQYGEAAFVIQNSVSAYVRRVEELYDETRSLNRKIVNKELIKDRSATLQNGIKIRKCKIDFDQFHIYEFDKDMAKNINFKTYEQKTVKCLHHCFSQLENPHAKLAINLFDILGEVIGKKYDFRCNQKLSNSGSLVEEFAAKDFITIGNSIDPFCITSFIYNNDEFSNNNDEFNEYDSHSQFEDVYIPTSKFEKNLCTQLNTSSTMYDGYSSENNDSSNVEIEFKNTGHESFSSVPDTQFQQDNLFTHNNKRKSFIENIDTFENEFPSGSRRSKRLRTDFELESGLNNNLVLKPLPFHDGIPEKLTRNRKEFQLPCNVKLLKNDSKRMKGNKKTKKILKKLSKVSTAKRNNCLARDEHKTTKCKNTSDFSPLESQLTIMKEDEMNELPSSHSKTLDNNEELIDDSTQAIQLQTGHGTISQHNSKILLNLELPEEPSSCTSSYTPPSPLSPSPSLSPSLNNMNSIVSPLTSNIQYTKWGYTTKLQNIALKYRNKFENDIKHKIKEIYEELDLHTVEDQKVNKWHEEIKPRLKAAEQKTPFRINDYESRILHRLETSNRKLQFDDIIKQEPPCEVARYFSATLQLASTHNLNINTCQDLGKSIELILLD